MAKAAKHLLDIDKEDLRILMAIEIGMKRSEYVTVSNIKFYARYPIEETLYRLKKVHKKDLIIRNASSYEIGYTLNSVGYDILALHTLVERGKISQLGPLIGKGKESDVYSCMDDDKNILALKIYRMGRTSFKSIKKTRAIVKNRKHLSWLYINRLAARREFEALKKIYTLNLNTPQPIAYNRHIVVMSYLRGKELAYSRNIPNPRKIFKKIIKQIRIIYEKIGIIHGDLGEFNIIIDENENILIIDWIQWVPKNHPNAINYLERDISNICEYFRKKYKLEFNKDEILDQFIENKY
ncbi:MAG: serine/threonine protein kinase [Promethearchaeota archaeon]|nr:MAG: serine/threonine protein kinase [Candidatus Lokiarchaeota archaeon]